MARPFELLLFSTDVAVVRDAATAGVDGIVVDWEQRDKRCRQANADTEINSDTFEDLCRVRQAAPVPVICRINGIWESTEEEIDRAIAGGASEILLPMVRTAREVEAVLDVVAGRCGVGMLIETISAVECARDFAGLPLSRVYVGLNDLAIERRSPSIFEAVLDGTVERLRQLFAVRFGFGGLTLPHRGHPVPCNLLIAEMMRLDCEFSFLRRSFRRDIDGHSIGEGLRQIRAGLAHARTRGDREVAQDRRALDLVLNGICA